MKFFASVFIIFSVITFLEAFNRDVFRTDFGEQTTRYRLQDYSSVVDADVENLYYYRLAAAREGKCLGQCLMRDFTVSDPKCVFLANFETAAKKCRKLTNANDVDMEDLYTHRIPRSREGRCHHACMMKEFGLADYNGRMDAEGLLKLIAELSGGDEKELIGGEAVVNVCKRVPVPIDHCEIAGVLNYCMQNESKRRGIRFVYIWGTTYPTN